MYTENCNQRIKSDRKRGIYKQFLIKKIVSRRLHYIEVKAKYSKERSQR